MPASVGASAGVPVERYVRTARPSPRAASPYAIGPHSLGWAILGASRNAAPRFLAVLRSLRAGADGAVRAWPSALYSHNAQLARQFALDHSLSFASVELEVILARPGIQCVYVANHPRHHRESVAAALDAGKHVLCEPPLALRVEEAQHLARLARQRGLILSLNYQQRYDPGLLLLRGWLHEHALGDLVGGSVRNTTLLGASQLGWRVDPAWGGVALDRSLRSVDAVRFITGETVRVLGAAAGPRALANDAPTAPDSAHGRAPAAAEALHGLLGLPRAGAVVDTFDAYLVPHVQPRIEIYGAAGSAALQPWLSEGSSHVYFDRHGERLPAAALTPAADPWASSISTFITAVENRAPAPIAAEEDIANLAICLELLAQAGSPTPG